jgi:hypothetical protein
MWNALERFAVDNQILTFIQKATWNTISADYQHVKHLAK